VELKLIKIPLCAQIAKRYSKSFALTAKRLTQKMFAKNAEKFL
jgi:hypothetical protein